MGDIKRSYELLAAAEEVLKDNPEDAMSHNNRGVALSNLGRYEEAIESFKQALHLNPKYAAAHYNMGVALYSIGRFREAINAFDAACEIKPTVQIYDKRTAALVNLGASLHPERAESLFKAAIRDADKAIELSWGSEGHYNKACALTRLHHYLQALEHLAKEKDSKGEEFDATRAWKDPHLAPLKQPPWLEKFEMIVGPEPALAQAQA